MPVLRGSCMGMKGGHCEGWGQRGPHDLGQRGPHGPANHARLKHTAEATHKPERVSSGGWCPTTPGALEAARARAQLELHTRKQAKEQTQSAAEPEHSGCFLAVLAVAWDPYHRRSIFYKSIKEVTAEKVVFQFIDFRQRRCMALRACATQLVCGARINVLNVAFASSVLMPCEHRSISHPWLLFSISLFPWLLHVARNSCLTKQHACQASMIPLLAFDRLMALEP